MEIKKSVVHWSICGFFSLAGIILMITLLALSTNREVSQEEYVVLYDTYNRKFDGVKEQGRYTTGVGVKFFPFQRTLQDLNVGKVDCLSSDKIEVELVVKIQIRLKRGSLIDLILKDFSDAGRHASFMKMIARSTLINTCLQYPVDDYFSDRSGVDRSMFLNLQNEFNAHDFGAVVEFFQLININLPPGMTEVITEKQNLEQERITAINDRTNELIQAETELLSAVKKAEVTIIEANNTAQILFDQAKAQEEIIRAKWENTAHAYAAVKENLQLEEAQFVEYLGAELYRQVDHSVVN